MNTESLYYNPADFAPHPDVSFVSSSVVKEGVICDVYEIVGDKTKDFAIIQLFSESDTPLQRVCGGEVTEEGYVRGKGKLVIKRVSGELEEHRVGYTENEQFQTQVFVGDVMQWQADPDSDLIFYEKCTPPFEDGRFENITEG